MSSKTGSENIPVIDFSPLSTEIADESLDLGAVESISGQVMAALKETGFLYLKNTGLTKEEVEWSNEVCERFFSRPKEEKEKFARSTELHRHHGWNDTEYPNPDKPADLKECFNCVPAEVTTYNMQWPSEEFKVIVEQMYEKLNTIALRFMKLIALGFGLEPDYFSRHHQKIGTSENASLLKCLYYYPLKKSDVAKIKDGQLRCSDHTDKGTITFLISEDISGLQVLNRNNEYVNLTKAEDPSYILTNLGDLMQRWADDAVVSANHRVVYSNVMNDSDKDSDDSDYVVYRKRQSLAYFLLPDNGTVVQSFNQNPKYEPVISNEFIDMIIKQLYKW